MIVSHQRAWQLITERVRAATSGAGGIVALTGEPGVGKSAVVRRALDDLEPRPHVVRIRCTPTEADLAWAGLSTLAADLRGHLASMPERPRALLSGLVGWGPAVHGDTVAVGMACLALLIAAADATPLVVVVDDARHLDTETRAVLEFAARRIDGVAVAIVIVSTRDESGFASADDVITLADLDRPTAVDLLRSHGLADPVAEELIDACGTRPLVLLDVAARLSPAQRNGAASLPEPLPAPLRTADSGGATAAADLYADRVAQLPADERDAIAVLALGGTGTPNPGEPPVASAVPTAAGPELPVATALGLVTRDDGGVGVTLTHPLVGRAVLGALTADERAAVHRRLAADLATTDPARARWHRARATDGPDETLATELEQAARDAATAGQQLDAYRLLQQAARIGRADDRRRRQLDAIDAAIGARLTDAAATLLDQLDQPGPDTHLRAARLQVVTGDLSGARDGFLALVDDPAVDDAVRAAAQLDAARLCLRTYDLLTLERLTRPDGSSSTGHAGDPEQQRRLAMLRTAGYASLGVANAIDTIVDHTHAELERTLLPEELRELAESFAIALARAGRRPELLRLADVVQRRAAELGVPGVAPALLIARAAYLGRSDLVGALEAASDAVALVEELRYSEYLAQALTHRANALAGLGDRRALDLADRIETYGGPLAEGAATLVRAAWYRTVGDHAGLITAVEHTHWRIGREPELSVLWHLDLFEAALAEERTDLVTDIRDTLAALHAHGGSSWVQAGLDRIDGLLAADPAAAVACFERSVTTFDERGYSINAARTQLVWAERLLADGTRADAGDLARRARTRFAVAGMGPWIVRCDELLARTDAARQSAGGPSPDPTGGPVAAANRVLTHRELQVARWLVDGATYRQIADQLFVSTRTVESHCGSIYRKLGVRGRSGLGARALTDRTLQTLPDTTP